MKYQTKNKPFHKHYFIPSIRLTFCIICVEAKTICPNWSYCYQIQICSQRLKLFFLVACALMRFQFVDNDMSLLYTTLNALAPPYLRYNIKRNVSVKLKMWIKNEFINIKRTHVKNRQQIFYRNIEPPGCDKWYFLLLIRKQNAVDHSWFFTVHSMSRR